MAPPVNTIQQKVDKLQKQVDQQGLTLERNRKKDLAEIQVHIFEQRVMAKAEKWLMTARNIGSAYADAAKRHRDAVADEDKQKQLDTQILFSVLTVLSTGALTWLWEAKALSNVYKLLGPILKDTFAAGLGEGFSANAPMVFPPDPTQDAVDQEPLHFQNDLENRVSSFKIKAHEFIAGVYDYIRSAPDASWDKMQLANVQTMTDKWLAQASAAGILAVSGSEDRLVDSMSREIERGMWRTWIFKLASSTQISPFGDPNPWIQTDYTSIHTGGQVAGRLKDLGILSEAGVEITRWHEAIEEDRPLIAWARDKYKPKLFQAE